LFDKGLSEAAVSQHLKILKEADLLVGEKRGYFMHYDVNRAVLKTLASEIEVLAAIERETCQKDESSCMPSQYSHAGSGAACSPETQYFCHGIGDLRKQKQQPSAIAAVNKNDSGE
jgi:ArsR family transcriptional regulator